MSYIGRGIDQIDNISTLDNLSFNGSDTVFNLTQNSVAFNIVSVDALQIQIDGIIQVGNFTQTGASQITFDFTPNSGSVCNSIKHFGVGLLTQPSTGSVGINELSASGTKDATTFLRGDNTFATVSGTTINNNADNRVITGSGTANTLEGEANLNFNGSLGVGITTPDTSTYFSKVIHVADGSNAGIMFNRTNSTAAKWSIGCTSAANLDFVKEGNVQMRIDSSGNIMVGKTSLALGTAGTEIEVGGTGVFTSSGNHLLNLNRLASDGDIVRIYQATSQEGSISVSGSTVSYNSFAGSHWSRLADNSKPTILRGTVMESISTLMDWYQVEYTKDEETLTEYIGALPDGKSVGDSHTVTVDGVEYTGTISKEDNERLPKCKISDTEDSKAVYGVFMDWDNDDDNVNDMYITSLGAFVVRIHGDETVAIGDYLQSKGDGTAKVQADDILRASTIAKVTSTEKTHTYDDGSYCVPCTLHCG